MARNNDLEYLLASLDPSYQENPLPPIGMGEFQPQAVQADMAPAPIPKALKRAPMNLDVKPPQAPSPLVQDSAQPASPQSVDSAKQGFDFGKYTDDARQALVDDQSKYDLRGNASAALAALGAAFQGGNSIQAANSVLDRNAARDKEKLEEFDQARKYVIEKYGLDRKVKEDSREDADLEKLMDPNSTASKMIQGFASKVDGKDYSKMSGYEIQKVLPNLLKAYDIDQRRLDRLDQRNFQKELAGVRQQDRDEAKQQKLDDRELKLAVPGFERTGEVLPKEEEAMKFRKATAVSDQLNQKLNRMKELVKDKGSFEYGGQAGQEMESLATEIQLLGKSPELYELGVLTGPDLSLLQKITADPSSFSSLFTRDSTRMKQIDSQLQSIQNKINSTAKSLGYQQKGGQKSAPQTDWSDDEEQELRDLERKMSVGSGMK